MDAANGKGEPSIKKVCVVFIIAVPGFPTFEFCILYSHGGLKYFKYFLQEILLAAVKQNSRKRDLYTYHWSMRAHHPLHFARFCRFSRRVTVVDAANGKWDPSKRVCIVFIVAVSGFPTFEFCIQTNLQK